MKKWKLLVATLTLVSPMLAMAAPAVNPNITPYDPAPSAVLSCGGAIISSISGRLEGDPSSGSAVVFNNGSLNISYDVIPAIQNSRVGDHVLMCLVFVPKNCPAGDTRGKEYTVTNLRSLESWTLPNSEHECGGL